MTRSRLLLSLALMLGWTLEQETEGRVQVRYGTDTDAPRVDWLTEQVNADDAGEEATNLLLAALVEQLRAPSASQPNDPLSTDTKAICAELAKLTAAYHEQTRAVVDEIVAAQEAPPATCNPISFGLRPLPPLPPSDLLQVNQAVLALIQRQTEAEERIYNRFCDMIERSIDKVANAVLQGQSVQLAHEQWMKQAEQAKATASDTSAKLDTIAALLGRFLSLGDEALALSREQMEADKAKAT